MDSIFPSIIAEVRLNLHYRLILSQEDHMDNIRLISTRPVIKKQQLVAGLTQRVEQVHIYLGVNASTQRSRVRLRPETISCMSPPSPLKGGKAQNNYFQKKKKILVQADSQCRLQLVNRINGNANGGANHLQLA